MPTQQLSLRAHELMVFLSKMNTPEIRTGQREIARALGVSLGTVSMALHELSASNMIELAADAQHQQRRVIRVLAPIAPQDAPQDAANLETVQPTVQKPFNNRSVNRSTTVQKPFKNRSKTVQQDHLFLNENENDDDERARVDTRFQSIRSQLIALGIEDRCHVASNLARAWQRRDDAEQQIVALFESVKAQVTANPKRFTNPVGFCISRLWEMANSGASVVAEGGDDVFAKAIAETKAKRAAHTPNRRTFRRPVAEYTDEQRDAARQRAKDRIAERARNRAPVEVQS